MHSSGFRLMIPGSSAVFRLPAGKPWLPCWQSDNSIWNMAPLVLTGMQCGLLSSLALIVPMLLSAKELTPLVPGPLTLCAVKDR